MSATAIIEVLDHVGGWVHPEELAYQLGRRGETLNELVLADLCREGRVVIEPLGYSLAEAETHRLHPPALPAVIRRNARRLGARPTTRTMILRAIASEPEREWSATELADATGRSRASVGQTLAGMRYRGEVHGVWCIEPGPGRSKTKSLWRHTLPQSEVLAA